MILGGLIAARFVHYLALAVLFGTASFALFAARELPAGTPAGTSASLDRRLSRTLPVAALGVLISALAILALTGATMAGALSGMVDPETLGVILAETGFGRVWSLRLVLAAALSAWLLFRLKAKAFSPGSTRWTALLVSGALLTTLALTGHAQIETGAEGLLHRAADAVHLVAAAVWLGALPLFLVLLHRSHSATAEGALRAGRLLQRFHVVGLLAVAALIVSGLVNSWFLVGDVRNLLITAYGWVLLGKLALFAAMAALAADNRLRLVPQFNRALADGLPPELWLGRLRSHIRAEFSLGLLVLLAVAVLGAIAPAVQAETEASIRPATAHI